MKTSEIEAKIKQLEGDIKTLRETWEASQKTESFETLVAKHAGVLAQFVKHKFPSSCDDATTINNVSCPRCALLDTQKKGVVNDSIQFQVEIKSSWKY